MTGDDEDKVGIRRHVLVADEQGRAETLAAAVEGHAASVASEVAVIHAVSRSHAAVPGFIDGAAMVTHVGVAKHTHDFASQRVESLCL